MVGDTGENAGIDEKQVPNERRLGFRDEEFVIGEAAHLFEMLDKSIVERDFCDRRQVRVGIS